MSADCNVCDFPAEFCGCPFGPQCTQCGMPTGDEHNCLAIFPAAVSGTWSGNEPLDTRPPELWIDLVHDECGGDW